MAKERAERAAQQEQVQLKEQSAQTSEFKQERIEQDDIAARKQEYLDQMSALREEMEINPDGIKKDKERE